MITFNHEKFVAQAIESVLSQQTCFPFELVIGEDCSSDQTANIIQQQVYIHPDKIRARFNNPNIGMMQNFLKTFSECRGRYIAILEGDDYWSDPEKLARQVRFLEENPTYSMCFHPVAVLENGLISNKDRFTYPVPKTTSILDLAKGNYIHTCSVMYRRESLHNLPENLIRSSVGDYYLHMLSARNGLIGCLPENMAVYRVHDGGVWSTHKGMDEKILTYLECMIGEFASNVDELLKARHKKISAQVFINNLWSDDAIEHITRAQRYGNEELLAELRKIVPRIKSNLLSRILRRLKH